MILIFYSAVQKFVCLFFILSAFFSPRKYFFSHTKYITYSIIPFSEPAFFWSLFISYGRFLFSLFFPASSLCPPSLLLSQPSLSNRVVSPVRRYFASNAPPSCALSAISWALFSCSRILGDCSNFFFYLTSRALFPISQLFLALLKTQCRDD